MLTTLGAWLFPLRMRVSHTSTLQAELAGIAVKRTD
jgi:hypothetical protein